MDTPLEKGTDGSSNDAARTEEKERILRTVRLGAQRREGVSLFASAIEFEELATISARGRHSWPGSKTDDKERSVHSVMAKIVHGF